MDYRKVRIYDPKRTIEELHISQEATTIFTLKRTVEIPLKKRDRDINRATKGIGKACKMVEYSEKAVAVFGETKVIKEELKAMGGRFNSRLTLTERMAGWIFPNQESKV